jgi:hypothetical protein
MPSNTVSVTRPGPFGNPFVVGEQCDRAQIKRWGWKFAHPEFVCEDAATAMRRFRGCLFKDEAIHGHVQEKLRGKNLACFCELCTRHADGKPFDVECADCAPCHAEPLGMIANG